MAPRDYVGSRPRRRAGGRNTKKAAPRRFPVIPALLAGDAAAGLSGVQHPASAAAMWGWLTVVGLLTITASSLACVWAWRQWGPGRMRGMATITEAHELLGEDRLWKVRHVVRPDLYPSARKANR